MENIGGKVQVENFEGNAIFDILEPPTFPKYNLKHLVFVFKVFQILKVCYVCSALLQSKGIEEHSKRDIQAISVCLIAISVQWLCLIAQLNNGAQCLIHKPRSSENKFHHGVGRTVQYISKRFLILKIYANQVRCRLK